MKKRIIGALYGIFLFPILERIMNWKTGFEKDYLRYCRSGCAECYRWRCAARSQKQGTPYRKFRSGREVQK